MAELDVSTTLLLLATYALDDDDDSRLGGPSASSDRLGLTYHAKEVGVDIACQVLGSETLL